jgi:hypothetical protein
MGHGCRCAWVLAAALALLALPAPALASPPANDDFSASLSTTSAAPVTFTGTTDGATAQPGEPNHAGTAEDPGCQGAQCMETVWYGWTAPRSALVTISTCERPFPGINSQLAVYTGTRVDALHEVASDDQAIDPANNDNPMCQGSQLSVVSFDAVAGTAYRVAVAGFGPAPGFTLHVSYGPWAYFDGGDGWRTNPELHPITFGMHSPTAGAGLRCRFDSDPFAACDQLFRPWDRAFSDGDHTIELAGTLGGDTFAYPVSLTFVVDTVPPDTTADGPPQDVWGDGEWWEIPLRSSEGHQQQYFACSIDGAAPTNCSPAAYDTGQGEIGLIYLCAGEHSVDASAVDEAGNVDPRTVHAAITFPSGDSDPPCHAPVAGSVNASGYQVGGTVAANVDPGGQGTSGQVEFGTTTAYGLRMPLEFARGTATSAAIRDDLPFLEPSTTYHARVDWTNRSGTAHSDDVTFTTIATSGAPPSARVAPASHVTSTTAALNGVVAGTDACHQVGYGFDLGTDTRYGERFEAYGGELSCGSGDNPVRLIVTGLRPGTTYHYRVLASSLGGVVRSADASFTTAPGPDTPGAVPTSAGAATVITGSSAPGSAPASGSAPAPAPVRQEAPSRAPDPASFAALPAPAEAGAPAAAITPRSALRAAITTLASRLPRTRRLTFVWPAAGRLTLRWHAGDRTLGTGTGRRTRAGRQAVALRLTHAGRATRRRRGTLSATFTPLRSGPVLRVSAPVRAAR